MRRRLFEVIEVSKEDDLLSQVYDTIMILAIFASILPLAFKGTHPLFHKMDYVTTVLFVVDYICRWVTADFKAGTKSCTAFVKYPFTMWAVIDLVSILPTLTVLNNSFKMFRLLRAARALRALRVLRIFKAFRYSRSFSIIMRVIKNSKEALGAMCTFAIGYILISALAIFNVEEQSFETFFDAVYWATVSLTTVGYGDIYPVTMPGRLIAMLSSMFGVAVVALPAGIITAGYMELLEEEKQAARERKARKKKKRGRSKRGRRKMEEAGATEEAECLHKNTEGGGAEAGEAEKGKAGASEAGAGEAEKGKAGAGEARAGEAGISEGDGGDEGNGRENKKTDPAHE